MELELIEAALQIEYPPYEGWKQLNNCELDDDFNIDFLFVRKGEPPVAVLIMDSPYIKQEDVMVANQLKCIYKQRMNGRELKVLLVYQEILFRPHQMPAGLHVMIVTQEKAKKIPVSVN